MNKKTYCGFVSIIGKPNVGKSTLLNKICGTKISIISKKPQTTRHKISAIKTYGDKQIVFIDTPGIHRNPQHQINKLMIKSALSALKGVDALVMVINPKTWNEEDKQIIKRLSYVEEPIFILVNKVDKIKEKDSLLPILADIKQVCEDNKINPTAIIPISAKFGDGVDNLLGELEEILPESPFMFPEEQQSDRSKSFHAAEIIREKIMRLLGEEVPHSTTVEIEKMEVKQTNKRVLHIHAIIWVERKGQKAIIIGANGELLKKISTLARIDLEKFFDEKVFLQLWVKVKKGWLDSPASLRNFGYDET